MGIYIYLKINPERIDPEEWRKVYRESLCLVAEYPFLDICKKDYYGKEYWFACHSAHRKENESDEYGYWQSYGDLMHGKNTEWFRLHEDLKWYRNRQDQEDHESVSNADVLLEQVENAIPSMTYVWMNKTQGEDSHIYLLAIGCLICHRFPEAAIIYGDISAGQCRKAVQWANQFLEEPIDIPVAADKHRLLARIEKLGRPESEMIKLFYELTLEGKSREMGGLLRKHLSEEGVYQYYQKKLLKGYKAGKEFQINWSEMKEYLSMGFSLKDLCRILAVDSEGPRMDAHKLLELLFCMKLHIAEKNTRDLTALCGKRADSDVVESVGSQLRQVFFMLADAGNRNVDAYIPLEQIYADCQEVLNIPLEEMISIGSEVLTQQGKEKTEADDLQNMLYDVPDSLCGGAMDKQEDGRQNYDITCWDDLIHFTKDSRVEPGWHRGLEKLFRKLHTFVEKAAGQFLPLSQEERKIWLLEKTEILISEEILERIDQYIMDDHMILRYIALCIVDVKTKEIDMLMRSCFWNPAFLDYYWELTEDQEE